MNAKRRLALALTLLATTAYCGDDGAEPDNETDAGTDASVDVDVDAAADVDVDADTTQDADDADADADDGPDADDASADVPPDADGADDADTAPLPPLEAPFMPAEVTEPYVDRPFLQEWNHTTPEVDPRVGALVDVVLPPNGFGDWPDPIQVTPRGPVRDHGEPLDILEPAAGESGVFAAGTADEAGEGSLVLVTADRVYQLTDGGDAVLSHDAPEGVTIRRATQGSDGVWLLTSAGLADARGTTVDWAVLEAPTGASIDAIAQDGVQVVVATDGAVAGWPVDSVGVGDPNWELDLGDVQIEALVLNVQLPQPLDVVVLHDRGATGLMLPESGPEVVDVPLFAADRVPLRGAVEVVRTGDGGFIAVGPEGAWRIMDRGDGPEWRVYPAERWLPNEDVRGVATYARDARSDVYFATAGGYAYVSATMMTLEQKMAYFVDRVVARHDRDGAVADSRLPVRGDLSSSISWDSDNDGGWTCYWVLAECSRWMETGAEDARANFDRSLERMLSFQTLTGTEHFLARAVIRREGCMLDDCDDPDDGEWFLSPDEAWWVKGDTSNDEVISHMFMMGPAYDWCATPEQQTAIEQHVTRIVGGMIDNGWQLIDIDGEPTRYGQFDPFYVNQSLAGMATDGGRRSAAALGMATLAYHVSGDERFLEAKQTLMDEHHYHENAVREAEYPVRWGRYSFDNNELSTQAWMALLRYETDPALMALWLDGWSRTFAGLVEQQGAMWNVADHMLGGDTATTPEDLNAIVRWLRLTPMDFIRWNIHNSHRRDLIAPPSQYEDIGRQRSDHRPIPYDERVNERWNADQYRVDRGFNGTVEMDGADVLAPYWLARRYGLIVADE